MNTITATIIEFIGEPIHVKNDEADFYYRKCKISHIGGVDETEVIAKTYDEIMTYQIGDTLQV